LAVCGAFTCGLQPARGDEREEGRPFLEVFAPRDYHGHQQVFDVAQATSGFVYFSNLGEVIEYDGAKFRGIGVPTSWIRKLAADDSGRIWLGGVDELGWVEPGSTGETTYHSLVDQLPAECRPLGTVWTVAWFAQSVWFATDRHILRWRDGRFEHWTMPAAPNQRLRLGGHSLWLSRRGDGLYRWSGRDWMLVSRAPELSERAVNVVIDDWTGGTTLLGTEDGRMWTLDREAHVAVFAAGLDLGVTRLTGGVRLKDGSAAITTNGQGVLVFDGTGKLIQRLAAEDGLPTSSAYSVTEDREGGVWVGTSMGVARVELGSPYTLFGRESGRGSTVAIAMQRSQGTLYLGSDEGVRRLVPSPSASARFEPVPGGRSRVFCMLPFDDTLLVGTDAGLARIVAGHEKIEMPTPVPVLGLGRSLASPERIFVGFPDKVVTYRHAPTGEWIDEGPIAAFGGEARTLLETADGNLWAGTTQRGFARITRGAGQTWQTASVEYFREGNGLPGELGWVRVLSGPGGPWFTTASGVFSFDTPRKTFVPVAAFADTHLDGKYTFPIAGIREGEIWTQIAASAEPTDLEHPTVGRLVRGSDQHWTWVPLPSRIVNQVGYYGVYEMLVEPGILWLGGQSALVRIETDRLDEAITARPWPLAWRRIARVGGPPLPLSGAVPALPFDKVPLRAEFTQPGFAAGRSPEFSYRLQGYNSTWSDWRTQSEIELLGLPAGRYTLEVRARDQSENGPGNLAFSFQIVPPWYASGSMVALYALLGMALVLGLVRWRLSALRQAKSQLESLVVERTRELRDASQRAETASRAKTLFLANVSHELRTPLHAILGYSQLLENDRTLTTGTRERLRVVGASGRHLLRLINEVLDLSKIEAGKQELRVEPFNLGVLLAEVVDAQETRAHVKGLTLKRPDITGLPESVLGDESKLRQVLDNLLGNAVKFTTKGEVSLAVTMVAGRLRFQVTDTGPGIAPDDLPRLFQPFQQAGDQSVSVERGTGLGLAITQRLVSLMGGEINLTSEIGQGSRFWFEIILPPAGDPFSDLPVRVSHDCKGLGRQVLAVDDVAANRELLRELLEPVGFKVVLAASAEEALAELARSSFELLILDLRLPGLSGLDLARRLRAAPATQTLPILAASASTLNQDPQVALDAGCNDFIAKPFLAEELLQKVSLLLDTAGPAEPQDPAAASERFDPETVRRLVAAAREGDVLLVREEIQNLRDAGGVGKTIDDLERSVQSFDVDRVAALAANLLPNPPSN